MIHKLSNWLGRRDKGACPDDIVRLSVSSMGDAMMADRRPAAKDGRAEGEICQPKRSRSQRAEGRSDEDYRGGGGGGENPLLLVACLLGFGRPLKKTHFTSPPDQLHQWHQGAAESRFCVIFDFDFCSRVRLILSRHCVNSSQTTTTIAC